MPLAQSLAFGKQSEVSGIGDTGNKVTAVEVDAQSQRQKRMELLDTFDKHATAFLSLARGLLDVTTGFTKQSPSGCTLTPVVLHWTLTIRKLNTFPALLSLAHSFSYLFISTGYTGTEVVSSDPHTLLYRMVDNHPSFRVYVRLRRTHA